MLLAVGHLNVRYRRPARYDDLVRIRCWVREVASRRITFGYAVEHQATGALLVTAETGLMVLDRNFNSTRLRPDVLKLFAPTPDPIRF